MKKQLMLLAAGLAGVLAAAEPVVPAPVTRITVFQQDLAAVIRRITPQAEPFLIANDIAPLEGTLWFLPAEGLSVQKVKRELPADNPAPLQNLTESFAGQELTVTLMPQGDTPGASYTGTVIKTSEYAENTLTLQLKSGGFLTIPRHRIDTILSNSIPREIIVKRPAWLVKFRDKAPETMLATYLTNNISWTPGYRLALGPEQLLRLDRSAVINNQLEDLQDVDVDLVSGDPSIARNRRQSAMAILRQLLQPQPRWAMGMDNGGSYAKASFASEPACADAAAFSPTASSGTSSDTVLTPLGKLTLAKGDAYYAPLDSGDATYQRLVDWQIPDRRDEDGRIQNNNSGELWDAVRFKNPLKTAITPGPVEVVDGDMVLGQSEFQWINPGEETLVKVTRARSITGTNIEYEAKIEENKERSILSRASKSPREVVWIAGSYYRTSEVIGEIALKNYRTEPAKLQIKLGFSGKLLSADGEPQVRYLERGVFSVNPQGELTWELALKPGEECKLNYSYSVLIRN